METKGKPKMTIKVLVASALGSGDVLPFVDQMSDYYGEWQARSRHRHLDHAKLRRNLRIELSFALNTYDDKGAFELADAIGNP